MKTTYMIKKIVPISIIGLLLLSGLGTGMPQKEPTQTKTVILSFSDATVQENNNEVTVNLTGANSILMKAGYYKVPIRIERFTFPFKTIIKDVQCTFDNIQHLSLPSNKRFSVASQPIPVGNTLINIEQYQSPRVLDNRYEYNVGTGLIENDELGVIVSVAIIPQYDPITNELSWPTTVPLSIHFVQPEEHILPLRDEYKFVIIAPTSYTSVLAPFVTHKTTTMHISTKLVTLDDIYNSIYFPVNGRDAPEQIKYFIKNTIDSWGTKYVLLVGGSSALPVRISHVYVEGDPDNGNYISDLYYADIYNSTCQFSSWDTNNNMVFGEYNYTGEHRYDWVDLYPDVYLGRLACINTNQVTTCVNKIITYETQKAYTKPWFNKMVAIGGDSFCPPEYKEDIWGWDEGEQANLAAIDIMGFSPQQVQGIWVTTNQRLDANNAVGDITSTLSGGSGFVFFSGHGNTNIWATHNHNASWYWVPKPSQCYKSSDVAQLSNQQQLPVVVISACLVGHIQADPACFAWSFLSNTNGGGIAVFAPTAISFGIIGPDDLKGFDTLLCLNVFSAYKELLTYTIGQMWGEAISDYIDVGYGWAEEPAANIKSVEMYALFGDPTLAVKEEPQPPATPQTPSGPLQGLTNIEYSYQSKTTDPNTGDQIWYNFSWGDNSYSGWIGPYDSGDTVVAGHRWTAPGTYQIKVQAQDKTNLLSPWSDEVTVEITLNENHPPAVPDQPTGPVEGEVDIEYTYSTNVVTDPDGDPVLYNFSFGDTTFSGWIPAPTAKHTWAASGTYNVKVEAKDDKEAQSNWSSALQVIIKAPVLIIKSITGNTNTIKAIINNTGNAGAINIDWKIAITGGFILFVSESSGSIDSIAVGEQKEVTLTGKLLLGIGIGLGKIHDIPTVTVTATAANADPVESSRTATIRFKVVTMNY